MPGSTLAVPTHRGRESHLVALLRSVAAANADASPWYPREIVVLTHDLPGIGSVIRQAVSDLPTPIRIVYSPSSRTVGALRNLAARHAATEWIHFMDSDTEAPRDLFTRLRDAIGDENRPDCFQLSFRPADRVSAWARFEARMDQDTCALYQSDAGVCGLNGMSFLIRTACLRRELFREDLTAAEDVELGFRLHARGVPVRFLPGVAVIHHYPSGLMALARRKLWHGRGYLRAWPHMPTVYRQLPTAESARAARAPHGIGFACYRRLALGFFRLGMLLERRQRYSRWSPNHHDDSRASGSIPQR